MPPEPTVPAVVTTPATPAPEAAKPAPSKAEALKAKLGTAADEMFAGVATQPATPKAEALAEAIESTGTDAPTKKPGETNASYETRLSKALLDLREAQGEAVGYRTKLEGTARERDATKRELEALRAKLKDPFGSLEAGGHDFESLVMGIREGKIKMPEKGPKVPDELRAEVDELKALKAEIARERAEAEAAQVRSSDLAVIKGALTELADELPLASALPWVPGRVLQVLSEEHARTGRAPTAKDLRAAITKVEAAVAKDVLASVSTESGIKALVANPLVRSLLLKALNLHEQATGPTSRQRGKAANEDGPRTLGSSVSAVVPARTEPLTEKERIARAAELVPRILS